MVEGITNIPRQTAATVEHFIVQVVSLEIAECNDTFVSLFPDHGGGDEDRGLLLSALMTLGHVTTATNSILVT
jgi:hypothetical protein